MWIGIMSVLIFCAILSPGFFLDWRFYPAAWRLMFGPRSRSLTGRTFDPSPARGARGRYLVEGILGCFRCHSERDWDTPGAPPLPGKKGAGYNYAAQGNPRLIAPNITPDSDTGAGSWTDDMLARSIREGIGHDGRALFPAMWYASFRHLCDEDVASVVVYVRSIPAVNHPLPRSNLNLIEKLTAAYLPEPITSPVPEPDQSERVKRGAYLASVADCVGCHTSHYYPKAPVHEQPFGGGNLIAGPIHSVMSPNITSDPSGISYYTEDMFISVMRTGKIGARSLDPVMPWGVYRNLSDDDLRALFAFLRDQPHVRHNVDNSERPSYCHRCRQWHGDGDRNPV